VSFTSQQRCWLFFEIHSALHSSHASSLNRFFFNPILLTKTLLSYLVLAELSGAGQYTPSLTSGLQSFSLSRMTDSASKFLLTALVLLVAITGGVFYYRRHPTRTASTRTKIGYQALASSWAYYVAVERGFFKEEGLEVETVRFDSSNTAAEAMLRGDIATDSATTMTVLLTIEANKPGSLKCFGFQMHTQKEFLESVIVKKNSGIKSYVNLKGKKIAVFPGSLSEQITKILLRPYLDPEREATIIQMSPPLQLQALESGQVHALVSYEPTTTIALNKGAADLLEHSPWARHIFEPFPVASYCFTSEFIQKQPDVAHKIARAWYRAIEYIRPNRNDAAATIPEYTGLDPVLARQVNQPAQQKATEVDKAAIQRLADLHFKIGIVKVPVDTSRIYYAP